MLFPFPLALFPFPFPSRAVWLFPFPWDSIRMGFPTPMHTSNWEVPGCRRGPGRPRTNWRSTINKDLQKICLTWEEAEVAALGHHESEPKIIENSYCTPPLLPSLPFLSSIPLFLPSLFSLSLPLCFITGSALSSRPSLYMTFTPSP